MNNYMREYDLIRHLLVALQGIDGKIISRNADGLFLINRDYIGMIDPPQKMLVEKLCNLGWLVNQIKNHINTINKDPNQGKVSKCLAVALSNELHDYYHMVTQIEQNLQKSASQDIGRTRASTPTSDIYGVAGVENRPPVRPSATYESLHTAIPANGYNNGHHHHHHQQANSDDGFGSSPTIPTVTLHLIHYWTLDHYFKLKILVHLIHCCKAERGGHLAKIVYRMMQNGDPQIKEIIKRVLSHVVLPLRHMLSQWIFHGEIQDPYDEFFICLEDSMPENLNSSITMMSLQSSTPKHKNSNNHQANNNHTQIQASDNTFNLTSLALDINNKQIQTQLQPHHRSLLLPMSSSLSSLSSASVEEKHYIINDNMMPGFISRQQANKILATGKAVHLLKKVCSGSVANSVPGYDDLKKSFESTNIEALFRSRGLSNYGEENEFEHLLNTAHKEVSQKALELLFGNFKLRSHFRGLRQYLLLGQGDFIRHLMDLLKHELDKPASECRFHNILSVLESAMHSTNAQFEDPDVKNRLDCKLLDVPSPNATGWDIFTLIYKVDGPISTVFTEEKIRDYIDIFRQLWRTKRVEHVLTSLWSEQMLRTKDANSESPELRPVLHEANVLLQGMIHFIQHHQNYIMFEVVECSWVELNAATDLAKDVDEVIAAHDNYLRKIKKGTLCQNDALFDCIFEFEQLMKLLWRDVEGDLRLLPESETIAFLKTVQSKIQTLAIKFQKNHQWKREGSSQTSRRK